MSRALVSRRSSRLAALALVAPLTLAACGGDEPAGEGSQGDSSSQEEAAEGSGDGAEGDAEGDSGGSEGDSGDSAGGVAEAVAGAADEEWMKKAKAAQSSGAGQFCLDLPEEALDYVAYMVPEPATADGIWITNSSEVQCEFDGDLTSEWMSKVTISHRWDVKKGYSDCQTDRRPEDMEPFGDKGVKVDAEDDVIESASGYLCDMEAKTELVADVLLHAPEDMPEGARKAGPLAGGLADALVDSQKEWGPDWEAYWKKMDKQEG
ncbi:hypothetical protein [Kytococcus sp. Marseille-QA3725]